MIRRMGEHPDLAFFRADPRKNTTEPPVLLVHGMGGDHSTWKQFSGDLSRAGRTVIAVDLRGHGRSGRAGRYGLADFATDLGVVLDELDVAQVDVVAHSLGAHSALRLAMVQPTRVRRLVLEEPPPMPLDDADLAENIEPAYGSLAERLRGIRALVANPMPLVRFDRAVHEAVTGQFGRTEPQWWDRLAEVPAPALVVSGGERSFLPPRHLRRIADTLPRGQFVTVASGHSVHRDRPRDFSALVRRHIND